MKPKGGLFFGHINDRTTDPDGLILESVANGLPVIYVAMNYRLNSRYIHPQTEMWIANEE